MAGYRFDDHDESDEIPEAHGEECDCPECENGDDAEDVADFTAAMEGTEPPVDNEAFSIVSPRETVVHAIKHEIHLGITRVLQTEPNILHIEMLIAFGDAYLWCANNFLARCDVETFEANRQGMLNILGIVGEAILNAKPSVEAVADAPLVTEVVQ